MQSWYQVSPTTDPRNNLFFQTLAQMQLPNSLQRKSITQRTATGQLGGNQGKHTALASPAFPGKGTKQRPLVSGQCHKWLCRKNTRVQPSFWTSRKRGGQWNCDQTRDGQFYHTRLRGIHHRQKNNWINMTKMMTTEYKISIYQALYRIHQIQFHLFWQILNQDASESI